MGIVYEVFDEKLHERRALKCAKPGFAAQLSPEARHSLRATHPNVCRVHDLAPSPWGPILVMEHIAGQTLHTHIRRRRS